MKDKAENVEERRIEKERKKQSRAISCVRI